MTTNQTIDGVPRAWLEEYEGLADLTSGDAQKLRALLDAPAKCEMCDGSGRLGMGLCQCYDMPAAQPQGEPVAWICHGPQGSGLVALQWSHLPPPAGLDRKIPLRAEQPAPVAVVPELTTELRWILGQMCFQHIHTAQALRLMGHEIAKKAEDEQAVTIYWMLGHYLKDPANWRQNASAEMKAAAPKA